MQPLIFIKKLSEEGFEGRWTDVMKGEEGARASTLINIHRGLSAEVRM